MFSVIEQPALRLAASSVLGMSLSESLMWSEWLAAGIGFLIFAGYVLVICGGNWRRVLCDIPQRPNRLLPELIVVPMLVFILVHIACAALIGTVPVLGNNEQWAGILAGIASHLTAGVVCVLIGTLTFQGGLRVFVLGSASWRKQLAWAVGGVLAVYPLCWAAAELALYLFSRFAPQYPLPEHDLLTVLNQPDLPAWMPTVLWCGALIVAPVAEEAFFRGVCQTALRHVFRQPVVPIVIVALFFGLAHLSQAHVVLPLAVLGFVLGLAYEKTGSLLTPIMLHLLFNLKTMIYFLLTQRMT